MEQFRRLRGEAMHGEGEVNYTPVFEDILESIRGQGKPFMRWLKRRGFNGIERSIYVPDDRTIGVIPRRFHIVSGHAGSYEGMPIVAALGQLAGDNHPVILGAVYPWEVLSTNGIDIKSPESMATLLNALPGTHTSVDHIAFGIGVLRDGNQIGLMVGDQDPNNRQHEIVPFSDLQDPKTKANALQQIHNLLKGAVREKYPI